MFDTFNNVLMLTADDPNDETVAYDGGEDYQREADSPEYFQVLLSSQGGAEHSTLLTEPQLTLFIL